MARKGVSLDDFVQSMEKSMIYIGEHWEIFDEKTLDRALREVDMDYVYLSRTYEVYIDNYQSCFISLSKYYQEEEQPVINVDIQSGKNLASVLNKVLGSICSDTAKSLQNDLKTLVLSVATKAEYYYTPSQEAFAYVMYRLCTYDKSVFPKYKARMKKKRR